MSRGQDARSPPIKSEAVVRTAKDRLSALRRTSISATSGPSWRGATARPDMLGTESVAGYSLSGFATYSSAPH
jgi:hypothetical protein